MVERSVTITNPTGLHARPAALFVKTAAQFKGTTIKVEKGGKAVDGKSLLSLLSLGVGQGTPVTLRAEGPDEQAAIDTLADLIAGGLGEAGGTHA